MTTKLLFIVVVGCDRRRHCSLCCCSYHAAIVDCCVCVRLHFYHFEPFLVCNKIYRFTYFRHRRTCKMENILLQRGVHTSCSLVQTYTSKITNQTEAAAVAASASVKQSIFCPFKEKWKEISKIFRMRFATNCAQCSPTHRHWIPRIDFTCITWIRMCVYELYLCDGKRWAKKRNENENLVCAHERKFKMKNYYNLQP